MTAIRKEAIELLERVPEDKLCFVIQIMRGVNGLLGEPDVKARKDINLEQFVDTAPIIYYLENSALYMDSIKKFFAKCIEKDIQIVTSAITVEEYLVFPYSSGKMEFADNFKRFIEYMNIEIVDIDFRTAEQGAKILHKMLQLK